MKLLSIKETVAKKDKQLALQVLRNQEIAEQAENRRGELNDIEVEFQQTLKTQQDVWAKEKEDHATWRNEAQVEVFSLENRRYLALLPLETQQEQLNNDKRAFEERVAAFEAEKLIFEEAKSSLMSQLDQVAERELLVGRSEKELALRKKGVEQQASSIAAQSKQLTIHLTEFSREMSVKNADLVNREIMVKAQTAGNAAQKERLEQWEQELREERRKLRDAYQQLEKSTKEIHG